MLPSGLTFVLYAGRFAFWAHCATDEAFVAFFSVDVNVPLYMWQVSSKNKTIWAHYCDSSI